MKQWSWEYHRRSDGDVRCNEMNCMRLVSHILPKVTQFNNNRTQCLHQHITTINHQQNTTSAIEDSQQGPAPRAVWNQLEDTRNGGPFEDYKWDETKREFIQEYTDNTNARDTVLAAVTTGEFIKPTDAGVKEHYTRIMKLCRSYIQMMPDDIN